MVDTYDPSLPTMRDRLRHDLFDFGQPTDPASVPPPVAFQITGALDPDETYDAQLNLYGEDEAKWRMAASFLARYGNQPDALHMTDGTAILWRNRVRAWDSIVKTWAGYSGALIRGRQRPLVGSISTVTPQGVPDGMFDANAPWYRGSAYPRFRGGSGGGQGG